MIYVELLLVGAMSGFLAGLLGIGGGFVVVPVLMVLLPALGIEPGLVPKVAVATSLAAMVPTACSAVCAQRRRGNLDMDWIWRLAPAAAVGALIGSKLAAAASGPGVAIIFACYTGYFAVKMLRDRPLQTDCPGRIARAVKVFPVPAVGVLIGGFSAIAGVGGASLTVPFLLFSAVEMKRAVAISSAVGLAIAFAGGIGFASAGSGLQPADAHSLAGLIHWPAALMLAVTATLTAPHGVGAAHKLPVRQLKRAFGAVLVAACVATLVKYDVQSAAGLAATTAIAVR